MLDKVSGFVRSESPSTTAKVLLVDDHALVAATVALVVSAQDGFEISTCSSVAEGLDAISDSGPFDVIMLDFNLPGTDGFWALTKMIEANGGRVAVFSGMVSRSVVERALALGAAGFIPKTLAIASLLNAIRFISAGETYLPSEYITGYHFPADRVDMLKTIEMKVLTHLCEGLQNKEIAHLVDLTEVNVKMHVKSICAKLGAKNRTQAVLAAMREQLC